MITNRKTCAIRNCKKKKNLFPDASSNNINTLAPSLYQYFQTCSIQVFWLLSQLFLHLRLNLYIISEIFGTHLWNALRDKHFPPQIENISLRTSFSLNPFAQKKNTHTHNTTLLFDSTLLKHGRHFEYWNQSLNMRISISYLNCHESGLCCYLVIHTQNLLHPLELFYFHLRSTY
jgi:hypothetical protein